MHECSKNDECWPFCKHVLDILFNTLTKLWVILVPSKTQCLSERSHKFNAPELFTHVQQQQTAKDGLLPDTVEEVLIVDGSLFK